MRNWFSISENFWYCGVRISKPDFGSGVQTPLFLLLFFNGCCG
jgi:hypothetical protein